MYLEGFKIFYTVMAYSFVNGVIKNKNYPAPFVSTINNLLIGLRWI